MKSGSLNCLEPSGPVQGMLYLTTRFKYHNFYITLYMDVLMVCCHPILYHLHITEMYKDAVYILKYRYSLKMDTDYNRNM